MQGWELRDRDKELLLVEKGSSESRTYLQVSRQLQSDDLDDGP